MAHKNEGAGPLAGASAAKICSDTKVFVLRQNEDLPGVRFLQLAGKPTDDELRAYIAFERRRIQRTHLPSVIVLSITEVWSSRQRRMMRDFELESVALKRHAHLGMAIVIPNAAIRGAFTAYYWLAPPDYPMKMIASTSDAYPFVATLLRARGVAAPDEDDFCEVAGSRWDSCIVEPGKGLRPISPDVLGRRAIADKSGSTTDS